MVSAYAAWHQMVPICTEANEATQTHCYNPVVPNYRIWAYYAHRLQRRCQEDPVSLLSGRLERQLRHPRITWLSTIQQDLKQHHLTLPEAADLAQNRPLWRMMSTYGATHSELHARNDDDDDNGLKQLIYQAVNIRWTCVS